VSDIDRQRVAAVRKLEAFGSRYDGGEWVPPALAPAAITQHSVHAACDAMHAALVRRADALEGCIEGSEEEAELAVIPTRSRPTKRSAGRKARSREAKDSGLRRQEDHSQFSASII